MLELVSRSTKHVQVSNLFKKRRLPVHEASRISSAPAYGHSELTFCNASLGIDIVSKIVLGQRRSYQGYQRVAKRFHVCLGVKLIAIEAVVG